LTSLFFEFPQGGTGPIVPGLVVAFVGPSLILYYYIVKAIQLNFICSWHEAKSKKVSFEKLQMFQRFRFVLGTKVYFVGFAVVTILSIIPVIYALTSREIYANAISTNGYQTTRC